VRVETCLLIFCSSVFNVSSDVFETMDWIATLKSFLIFWFWIEEVMVSGSNPGIAILTWDQDLGLRDNTWSPYRVLGVGLEENVLRTWNFDQVFYLQKINFFLGLGLVSWQKSFDLETNSKYVCILVCINIADCMHYVNLWFTYLE